MSLLYVSTLKTILSIINKLLSRQFVSTETVKLYLPETGIPHTHTHQLASLDVTMFPL